MSESGGAASFVPSSRSIDVLASAAQTCRGCELYRDTTQAVFGEGRRDARLMLVGEQPGDREDRQGHPFVGPAGLVLWKCLDDAGINRDAVYVTNAVKHFKHETRGKRRIHKRPGTGEVDACHPWLDAELASVDARVVVALGATALRALLGRTAPIAASRGRPLEHGELTVFATYHPSAALRDQEAGQKIRAAITADLVSAWHAVSATTGGPKH
jgi:DNA polymerase